MRERIRIHHVAWLVAFGVGIALSFSRLLGIHGPESALVLGVALTPFCAAIGARTRIAGLELAEPVAQSLRTALVRTWIAWGIAVGILALNQLRVRNCSMAEGLAFMVLGPGLGCTLGALVGVTCANWVERSKWATALAVLVPIASYLSGLWAFWSTPAIFVFDHFGGWFPGTLYDEDVTLPLAFITFRLATLCWIGALVAFAFARERKETRPLAGLAATLLAAGAIAAWAYGPELAHRSSQRGIDDALGRIAEGERCILHVPRELTSESVQRFVDDCDFRVVRAEQALGVQQRTPVHAFFYRNAEEKRRWMGAGRTYIAKPWRTEVHLQLREWPHGVLAHEVVHVVAGNAARGPFDVSGTLGGWVPNPGLIEGVAVAVEWPEHDGMNPHQLSLAMKQLDQLPELDRVMGLGFLALPARRAYTAAGSFVRWVLDTRGAETLRRVHREGSLDALGSVADLERAWHSFLDGLELPEGALALTELRFHRASIFASTCPHAVARLHQDLALDLASGDDLEAIATCDEILDIEPGDLSALVSKPGALARRGRLEAAEAALERLDGAPPPLVARARESIADAHWLRGNERRALEIYEALLEVPQSDDEARAREVKTLALRERGPQSRLVRDLLVGPNGRSVSSTIAVHLAREIDRFRPDGLGRYLEARQLMGQERFDLALVPIQDARRLGLPTERIQDEALRMEGMIRFANGDLDGAETVFRDALERPRLINQAQEWLDRIAYHRAR